MITRLIDLLICGLIWFNAWLRRIGTNSVVKFLSSVGASHVIFPVLTAKEITNDKDTRPAWYQSMVERAKFKKQPVKFVRCPGMHDYMNEGFIIRAHTDIHIKANSMGVVVTTPHATDPQLNPTKMDYEVVEGIAPIDGVKPEVYKVPLPFGVHMEPGHSMHLLPALLHSADLMDKLYIYPGTVDYERFHTANVIFTVIKPCEFVIKAGTPLLQGLPFKRVSYHGVAGRATVQELNRHRYIFPSRILGFYRRMFHFKKTFTSEVRE